MNGYPEPSFHFLVDWGGSRTAFSEVSGLDVEFDVIEYRDGADPQYQVRKMPGRPKFSNIVMKRGMMPPDNDLFEWVRSIQLNQVQRRNVVISLLNAEHEPVVSWKISNAFPVKLEGPVLNAAGNDVAIETLELAHDGFVVEMAGGKRSKS